MSCSIGGISMIRINGRCTPIAEAADEYTRYGTDGHGAHKIGRRAPEAILTSVRDVDGDAGVVAHVNNCAALKSTLVTINHGDGTRATNVLIREVEFVNADVVAQSIGGVTAGNRLVTMRWTCRMTASSISQDT